jgi:hypothetical protein
MTTDEIMALADSYAFEAAYPVRNASVATGDYLSPVKDAREAIRAAIEALQADASRFLKLGALVAFGDWGIRYSDGDCWVDDVPDLRARLDAEAVSGVVMEYSQERIDAAMALDKS